MILALLLALVVPDTSGVLRLSDGRGSLAHGCALTNSYAFTNAHVVKDSTGFQWSTRDGKVRGFAKPDPEGSSPYSDLAIIEAVPHEPSGAGLFPHVYKPAKALPEIGARVFFVAYEFTKGRKKGFTERLFSTTVQYYIAGLMILADGGVQGSSGSCVFNEDGEIVGVNAAIKCFGRECEGGTLGVAVPFWSLTRIVEEAKD